MFRAGLHEALLQRLRRPDVANALTALAFAMAHALAQGDARALAVALPAWLIGRVYERGRRLRHCVALHALLNAAWIAWALGAAGYGPF
ncbi:MAG: CPBP family glutamic-type intramembrane protease [Caldimonas sp.]